MPRPSNTRERRQQIAEALIRVMSDQGYEGASIGRIAQTAGLTQGLVHYHFRSKQEILIAVLEELQRRHVRQVTEAVARAGDRPLRRLDAFIDVHVGPGAYRDGEALACWIFLSGQALREPDVQRTFAASLGAPTAALQSIIADGLSVGDFGRGEPAAASAALMAAIQGYFVLGATARALIPRGSAARETRRMATGLLDPAEPLGRNPQPLDWRGKR